MKDLFNFLGIGVAGLLGYLLEPSLRFQLTGVQTPIEVIEKTVVIEVPAPEPQPTSPKIDLASLTPGQLPEKVLLKAEVKVADSASGVVMSIQAGNRVKPLRIEGENLVISPGAGPFVGKLPISDTDLLQQLAANPPPPVAPAPEPPVAVAPEPAPTPTGESEEPSVTPEPTPAPEPAPAPEPNPAPEMTPPVAPAGNTDVVKAMQESVRAAQIKEFTFEQVLTWEAGAEESVDGETYQTGLASYKAETIFGVKTIQAKALLKGGKVLRWIWPKSGMEIK